MADRIMGIEEARMPLGELVLAAQRNGTVTTLTRYGNPAAAIVPMGRVSRAEPMTYAAAVDNVSGAAWRLTVCETDISGYDDAGLPVCDLWSGREVLSWDTAVPAPGGDPADAVAEAEDVLRHAGWRIPGDWEPASEGYYADVERANSD